MSRHIIAGNISENLHKIERYQSQLQLYIKDNPPEKIISEIACQIEEQKNKEQSITAKQINTSEIAINVLRNKILNNKSLYLLMNTLFNKNGKISYTQNSRDMMELFLESVFFDILMETIPNLKGHLKATNVETIRDIQAEGEILSGTTLLISIFPEHEGKPDFAVTAEKDESITYNIKDRGKYMFYLYIVNKIYSMKWIPFSNELSKIKKKTIINYIQTTYKSTDKEAEIILLIYLSEFINKIYDSNINFYKKLEYLYALKEYEEVLCSMVYAMIVEFKNDKEFVARLEQYKDEGNNPNDIKTQLERIQRNISNRKKSFADTSTADSLLCAIDKFINNTDADIEGLKNIPVSVYLNLLLDTVEDWDNEKHKQKMKKDFDRLTYTLEEYAEFYKGFRNFLPQNCLIIEEQLRKNILYLLKFIKKYQNDKSREMKIYSACSSIYIDMSALFEKLEHFDKINQTHDNRIWHIMRQELAGVLFSSMEWEGNEMTLIDFIKMGHDIFNHWSNYYQITKFNDIHATLFVPYLKSLTIFYNFIDADETVSLIIETFNQISDYVKNIIVGLCDKERPLSKEARDSTIHNDMKKYLKYSQNNIRKKLFVNWETRTRHGQILPEEIRCLLINRRKIIKKFSKIF